MPDPKIILVVDDDIDFRKSIIKILRNEGYITVEASNGLEGRDILGTTSTINLILSDVKMANMHGVEFLHLCRRLYDNIPFIMMTGFSDIIEVAEAYEIGVSDFLSKPFTRSILLDAVKISLDDQEKKIAIEKKEKSQNSVNKKYLKLGISYFANGNEFECPIYLKLGSTKFIKIANKAEDLSPERISTLESKGVNYFFIEEFYFQKFVKNQIKLACFVTKQDVVPKEKKDRFLKKTNELLFQTVTNLNVEKDIFDETVEITKQIIDTLCESVDIFTFFEEYANKQNRLYTHTMFVTLICSLIAREKCWTSMKTITILNIACLFHDASLAKMPDDCLNKEILYFSDQDYAEYKLHPKHSADLVSKFNCVSGDVLQIIKQHHEYCNGKGIPYGLFRAEIHPMAKMICLSSDFSYSYFGIYTKGLENDAQNILFRMEEKKDQYDKNDLKILKELFE